MSTRASTTVAPLTFKQVLADIKTGAFWVALFVSLPTLTLPAIITKLLDPGDVGAEDVAAVGEIVGVTAPLTAAVAIIAVAVIREWFDNGWVITLFAAATLALTSAASARWGIGQAIDMGAVWENAGGISSFVTDMFGEYLSIYGGWPFVCSLVVGGFLGWAWAMRILPYLRQREQPAALEAA